MRCSVRGELHPIGGGVEEVLSSLFLPGLLLKFRHCCAGGAVILYTGEAPRAVDSSVGM